MCCIKLVSILTIIILFFTPSLYGLVNSPKIITKDGHLIFESGLDRNITFLLKGKSRLNINDEYDIIDLLLQSKRGRLTPALSSQTEWTEEEDAILKQLMADATSLKTRVFGPTGLEFRYRMLQNRTRNANQLLRRYKIRMQIVETRVQLLYDTLETDNCKSNPCQNGGSCLNIFGRFVCKCPKNFEGTACEKDVNECALYAGTDLGCQNGAQCINQFGSYSCICQPGWFGIHCTQRKGDCMQSSIWELCGHGTCVSSNDTFGYKCICDQGWKTNGLTPACTVDVDECAESHTACVTKCINLPGSFTCAPCPAGLMGNGVNCRDIDECATQNGGCNLSPKVSCINSYGSYHCGECPLGWSGDGRTCERSTTIDPASGSSAIGAVTTCSNSNICHPRAICHEISNTVVCSCPDGLVGSGIGINGCVVGTAKNCLSQPCLNGGTCVDDGDRFNCICPLGFLGPTCTPAPSFCSPNPCHNGGRCHVIKTTTVHKFLCECRPGFRGEKCEKRANDCGGVLRGESGRLSYPPGVQSQYEHNSQCAWIIRTNEILVLNVTFNNFELEDSTECRFDWLQINDGHSAGSQIIGRFCGTHKPLGGNILSSTHQLYLWFRSDNSTSKEGFDLEWNSIPPQCGGLVNVTTHGTISSPGSPGNYPKNRDCRWTLKAPNDKRLKLTFFSLQIEKHDSCNYDYVEIIDAISGETLNKYCNSTHPQPVFLPTNEAIIHFHTDNIGSDTGFQIFYSTEERVHNCGGIYTAKDGIIQSPHIQNEAISCEYEIRMATSESITIEFEIFKMASEDCIEIYDVKATSNENILQAKYCGEYETIPPVVHSQFNKMILKFYGKPGAEFKLKYRTDCSYNLEASEGVIQTPSYPQLSNKERYCTYKIITEPNTVISVHVDDFDLKDSSLEETDCAYTSLKINDDLDKNIMGPFCGEKAPMADIVSKTNMLILHLQTGLTSTGRGFKLSYKAVPMGKTDCGGVYTKPGYSIRLPTDEQGLYMHDMTCYWIIMAPKDKFIMIDWKSFDLEESSDCSYDYVELYDNLAKENNQALERYCNAHYPQSFLTHSNILTVKFVSDVSDSAKGFEFSYKFIDATNQCGGKIHSSNGKIHTPNWPSNYTGDLDCTWIIITPPGTQIELQIEIFDLEMSNNCSSDWLEIRNGGSNHSTLLGRFCGNMTNIPHVIPSFTNQMYLFFHSNGFVNQKGFQIRWFVFSNGCGGNLEGEQGVVTSPFYPEPYPNKAECDWRLHVHPGSAIHLTIVDLALENYSNCRYDTLSIFEGTTDIKTHLASICQMNENKEPLEYIINSNEALIQLKTDDSNRERGFLLSYRANCSVTLSKNYGVIESPNYGVPFNDYSDDVNCTWTLKAPKGNHIQAEFTYYDTVDKKTVLDIRDGNNKTYGIQQQGQRINSTSDTIVIKQRSNKFNFQLEYAMVGCIEVYRADNGTFASPNYPKPYPNNIECLWEITSQPGMGIQVEIESLDLEDSVNCTKDALVISPHYHSDNVKERHCGKHESLIISSSSHKLYVRFYSDGQGNGQGFQVKYTTQKSKCGGTLQSKNGVITSPNYPNNYPENSDCEWTITVTDHHAIIFTMDELDLEDFYDCEMDYVEAFEERSDSDAEPLQLFKKCGAMESEANNTWRSIGNTVTVRFHSDDSVSAKGFKLSYVEDCGERIVIDDEEYVDLTINKYSLINQTCEWQIIAKNLTKHVTLAFSHIQLNPALAKLYPTEGDCINIGIVVYDGSSDASPVRSRFCKSHPPDIVSNGHALTLKVPMGLIAEVDATVYAIDNLCGNYFKSITGKFASPNYPSSYPVNIQCTWYIMASQGNSIGLTFESMDLEDCDECNNDYLEVRGGLGVGTLLGLHCGNRIPAAVEGAETLSVIFNSNDDIVGEGFIATYYYVKHNEINGTSGVVESPAYPSRFHSDELYSWRITVDRNYVVLLSIKHILDTDIPYIKESDQKFYDGYSDIGAPIDYANTHVIRSNTNILYFTATRGPFQFKWKQLSKDVVHSNQTAEKMSELCGNQYFRINKTPLLFSSPGYPQGYDANLQCAWTVISNNPAMHTELLLLKIDLEEFDECFADYVKVSKSSDLQNWQELEKMCKTTSNKIIRFEGNPYLKVEFVTDTGVNKTGFAFLASTKCGAELGDRRGFVNITELNVNSGFNQQDCVWTIRVRQGRRIRLSFPDFWLRSPNTDCKTYILVRNGMAEDSPFLGKGKYCDNDITDILETSSNRAYIKFTRTGFSEFLASFHYEEIIPECSKEIILNENYKWDRIQTITTPNYPNIPNPHSECIWKIIAPLHKTITLDFFGDYDLIPVNSDSKQCELEYVQVNDGATEMAPVIGKYCGAIKPNTIRSTGNILRVLYFTDVSEPHKGFQANVSISRCGGSYYDSEGIITAPLLRLKPNEKELECVYTLEMPLGSTINISVDKISLPEPYGGQNSECKQETHLELQEIDAFSTDTENITDTLFLCGSVANRYIVETNKLRIVLRIKDGVYDADSFQISYSVRGNKCVETIVGKRGILQTPKYPKSTGAPIHCIWNLRVPKGRRIKVEFLDFDMNSGHSTGQIYRSLTSSNDPLLSSIIERVTDTVPAVIYSTDNTMTIHAYVFSFFKNRGFKLKYSSDEYSTHCRNLLWFYDDSHMATPQTIKFKRDDNEKSLYCAYDLRPSFNQTLSVQIVKQENYKTTHQRIVYSCKYSSAVQLFSGDERILPLLMCRNDTQPSFRLPYASKMVINFHNNNGLHELELQLTSYKCGGVWSIEYYDDFVITQPDMKNHTGHLECAWAVWGQYGNTLEPPAFSDILENMQVDVGLTTDFKGKCAEEYLIVYNGHNQDSPHLGRYCEQSTITNLVATGGIFVEFITQNYNPLSVFNLTVHEGSGCGGELKYPYRQIIFDYQYKNNVECVWSLATVAGFHLAAIFRNHFFIESSPNCSKDFLKFQQRSLQGEWQDIVTVCGRSPPPMINTTTAEMRVIFRSDEAITGRGFTINFDRNCGGILFATDTMQQLNSPNYPLEYPPNLVCNYTIIPSPSISKTESDSLYIRFIDFIIEESTLHKCMFDNVTIITRDNQNEPVSNTLCGRKTNYQIRSKKSISIIFQTDGSYGRKGFLMNYGHNKCSAVITNSTIIESPRDSSTQMYPHNSICSWQLQALENYKIMIKFEQIDFESQGMCTYDAVEVYKGLNTVEDQRLVQLCGNITGQTEIITIQQNTGLIRSFSDDRDASAGFKALVRFLPNCDNHIHLESSNSSYEFTRFSGQYANNLDCSWLFTTSADRQLKLEFTSFHVENSSSCLDDYLDVRDGSGSFSDQIGQFCGHDLPSPLVSSKSTLLLRFVTDSKESSSGFMATIRSVPKICGQQNLDLTLKKAVTIVSPDDGSSKYPNNINCVWKIKSDNNIHLHFEKLDIDGPDTNGSCSTDYIKIINSDDADEIDKGYGSKLIFNGRSSSYLGAYNYAAEHIYCGNRVPDDYFSSSKSVFVKFKSNNDVAKSGFKLKATTAEGCFRNFTATQGRIKLSESTDHCDIYIKVPVNYTLSLYYNELMFSEYDCEKENIEVFDARTNSSLQKLCEFVDTGKSLFSNSNELRMRLKLSGYYTQIDITYLASNNGPGCGGDFYNTQGLLTNPYYPNHVRNNSDCRWNIRVPGNMRALLRFPVFNMGAKSTCRTDYLQIIEYDGHDSGEEKLMRQFCGEDEPNFYLSSKSYVTIRFHKTVNYDGTGWVISFRGVHPSANVNYIY
ncbi:cubilin homolog [Calliphora vicina]|uniref:cubilin homolog n=1 Tax=Calliphora vicina TaxID=7373 RepID=UPI00325A76D2